MEWTDIGMMPTVVNNQKNIVASLPDVPDVYPLFNHTVKIWSRQLSPLKVGVRDTLDNNSGLEISVRQQDVPLVTVPGRRLSCVETTFGLPDFPTAVRWRYLPIYLTFLTYIQLRFV